MCSWLLGGIGNRLGEKTEREISRIKLYWILFQLDMSAHLRGGLRARLGHWLSRGLRRRKLSRLGQRLRCRVGQRLLSWLLGRLDGRVFEWLL